ncbi:hypothetical protein D915_008932 [Fasciola hepatica]|uniref:Uncharacterized protein n=1 Tax=Fasciola hepatica TaxID=6192 RepID=A0A4E0R1K9_FASHE|nr:hypothetical protein D915_008932 [Fasciola hepatica]
MVRASHYFDILLLILWLPSPNSWKLSTNIICEKFNSSLYELTAHSESATVHALLAADGNIRPPALILVYSPRFDSAVDVNCSAFGNHTLMNNSVHVHGHTASYGILFFQACTYVDGDDTAEIPDNNKCDTYFGANLIWSVSIERHQSIDDSSPSSVSAHLRGVGNDSRDTFLGGGSVQLNFTLSVDNSPAPFGMDYTISGGLHIRIDVGFDRVNLRLPRERIAPSWFVFSNQSMEDNEDFEQIHSAANTPLGTMKSTYLILDKRDHELHTSPADDPTVSAFVLLPPLSYTSEPETVHSKDQLRLASPGPRIPIKHKRTAKHFSHSLVRAFYGKRFDQTHQGSHAGQVGARKQFINLGSPGDGFYRATNYSAWTMVLGLGSPDIKPDQKRISSTAIAAVVVATMLVGAAGGLYWHRKRAMRTSNVFRLESEPSAALVPSDDGPLEGVNFDTDNGNSRNNNRSALVEPFMARKLQFRFLPGRFRRARQIMHPQTEPLLASAPPSYEAVVQQRLVEND